MRGDDRMLLLETRVELLLCLIGVLMVAVTFYHRLIDYSNLIFLFFGVFVLVYSGIQIVFCLLKLIILEMRTL